MLRPVLLTAILLLTTTVSMPAMAQADPPSSEGGRYSFTRIEDGYLRLDQKTGQVSTCSARDLGWACFPVPDERQALEEEIGRLQQDNAALKKELLAHGITPPGMPRAQSQSAPKPEGGLKVPEDADVDRAMAFVERIWKRLVDMIARLQREI